MCVLANILSYHPLRSSNSAHLLLAFRNQLDATSSSNQVVSPDVDVLPKEELAATGCGRGRGGAGASDGNTQ